LNSTPSFQEIIKSGGFASDSDEDNGWTQVNQKRRFTIKEKGKQPEVITYKEKTSKYPLPPPIDWSQEYGRRRYKMQTPLDHLPGNDSTTKIRSLSQALAHLESFTSIRTATQDDTKLAVALFGSEKDALKAQKIMLSNDQEITMIPAPIFNPISAKSKTIRVWDIPLNTTKQELNTAFSKYGEIQSISVNTIGMWQSANIQYTNQEDYNKLVTQWAIPFKADLIRIFPFLNTNEIKEEREQYSLRLSNLPPGTTGYDLKEILKNTHGLTCYIPRTRNYMRKRMAIISFLTAEHAEAAKDTHVNLGNTILTWHDIEEKLCAVCSSDTHFAKDCEERIKRISRNKEKRENHQKYQHLYQRYKPTGSATLLKFQRTTQKFKNKSFAQVTKEQPQQKQLTNTIPIHNTHSAPNDQNISLSTILQAIQQLGNEIKIIQKTLTQMDKRIGYLEDDAYFYHTSTEFQEENDEQEREQSGHHTPEYQTAPPPEAPFNYQRKRPAHSPAIDIRDEQLQLHSRISNMDNTINSMATAIHQLIDETIVEPRRPPSTQSQ
jgi:RNA recognition motif-containing protein